MMLKNVYDKLVAKVNSIDTSAFVLKTKYDTDKLEIKNKIPDTSGLVKKTDCNAKRNEIEDKIPDVGSLATKTALTTVENKMRDVTSLVKKTNYKTKITEIQNKLANHNHDKYLTTPEFNTLAADVFNGRLKWTNLVTKTDFDNSVSRLNNKIAANKTKNEFIETNKPPATSDNSLTPLIDYHGNKIKLIFTGSCLKQPKISYTHRTIENIYIVYELGASSSNDNDPTLKNCLFGAAALTKNADIDKYGYSGYGIGFYRRSSFSFPGGGFGQNVSISGADMSSSAHINNKKKDILVVEKGPTQGLKHTLIVEKIIQLILLLQKRTFA